MIRLASRRSETYGNARRIASESAMAVGHQPSPGGGSRRVPGACRRQPLRPFRRSAGRSSLPRMSEWRIRDRRVSVTIRSPSTSRTVTLPAPPPVDPHGAADRADLGAARSVGYAHVAADRVDPDRSRAVLDGDRARHIVDADAPGAVLDGDAARNILDPEAAGAVLDGHRAHAADGHAARPVADVHVAPRR